MNRDATTRSALIALARSRRIQRALAHAHIHRDASLPTLKRSLGYMTATASFAVESDARGHHMTIAGISIAEATAYVVEELGADEAPIVYRLALRGPRRGHLVPIRAWYEQADEAAEIRARLAAIAPTLEPVVRSTTEAWMLSTRIIQRRALRVAGPGPCPDLPIRKYALQLVVEPVGGDGPRGATTVTAFLRPHAVLQDVWSWPASDLVIARVAFTGIPSGLGLSKDTVVLLAPRAASPDTEE